MSEDDDIVLGRPGHEPGDAGTPLWYENQRKAMEEMNAGLADQLRATPMSEAQPETVAGRATLKWFIDNHFWGDDELLLDILAIEAEARAAGVARYEAALRTAVLRLREGRGADGYVLSTALFAILAEALNAAG